MAPATRRSSGLGSLHNSPSNVDYLLEHFNQFKRKHITQNRDIIKTNALAQLRIKELEDKVLALEAERSQKNAEIIKLQTRLHGAEDAGRSLRQGWQAIGESIAALTAIDGFAGILQGADAESSSAVLDRRRKNVPRSTRITIDPNVLPGGVARSVARPPEDLPNLKEESSAEMELTIIDSHEQQEVDVPSAYVAYHAAIDTEDTTRDEDDDDEDEPNDGLNSDIVSFATDAENTIRVVAPLSSPVRKVETRPGSSASDSEAHDLHRMTSIDSLSSFADDEEIELSTDEEQSHIASALRRNGGKVAQPSPLSNEFGSSSSARKPTAPLSPEDVRAMDAPDSTASTPSKGSRTIDTDDDASHNDYDSPRRNGMRSSRRSSMRDRKSVNYALPKLNTKMRKPDPVDLIPAERGEERKPRPTDADDTPEEEPGTSLAPNGTSPAGSSSGVDASPAKRTLKGKHEVASTGNLREIRQRHQRQYDDDKRRQGQNGASSSSSPPPPPVPTTTNTLPRKKSSKTSLRRRSSSNAPQEDANGTNESDETQVVRRGADADAAADTQSTPARWRSFNSTTAINGLPITNGTPIPKAGGARQAGKAGQPVGGIKALNKAAANRMHSKSSSSLAAAAANGQGQPKRIVSTPISSSSSSSSSLSSGSGKVLGNAVRANANGGHGAAPGPASIASGDPSKRSSLHAAMTNMTSNGSTSGGSGD